jgi:hypothetical protein
MIRRSHQDISIPSDNYSAADREWLKLLAVPAWLEAEQLIAEKFAQHEASLGRHDEKHRTAPPDQPSTHITTDWRQPPYNQFNPRSGLIGGLMRRIIR